MFGVCTERDYELLYYVLGVMFLATPNIVRPRAEAEEEKGGRKGERRKNDETVIGPPTSSATGDRQRLTGGEDERLLQSSGHKVQFAAASSVLDETDDVGRGRFPYIDEERAEEEEASTATNSPAAFHPKAGRKRQRTTSAADAGSPRPSSPLAAAAASPSLSRSLSTSSSSSSSSEESTEYSFVAPVCNTHYFERTFLHR